MLSQGPTTALRTFTQKPLKTNAAQSVIDNAPPHLKDTEQQMAVAIISETLGKDPP